MTATRAAEIIGQTFDASVSETLPGWLLRLMEGVDMALAWTTYEFTFADFAAAATSNDIEGLELVARGVLHAVCIEPTEEFRGGAIATYTLSVGLAGSLDLYSTAFDVYQLPGDEVAQLTTLSAAALVNLADATSIRLAAVSTGADLDEATTGAVRVHVLTSGIPA